MTTTTFQPRASAPGAVNGHRNGLRKFEHVAEELRAGIRTGTYRAGRILPTEAELADQYSVSRVTVRQALALLRAEGLITTTIGVGSRVRRRARTRAASAAPTTAADWTQRLTERANDTRARLEAAKAKLAAAQAAMEAAKAAERAAQAEIDATEHWSEVAWTGQPDGTATGSLDGLRFVYGAFGTYDRSVSLIAPCAQGRVEGHYRQFGNLTRLAELLADPGCPCTADDDEPPF